MSRVCDEVFLVCNSKKCSYSWSVLKINIKNKGMPKSCPSCGGTDLDYECSCGGTHPDCNGIGLCDCDGNCGDKCNCDGACKDKKSSTKKSGGSCGGCSDCSH